MKGIQSAEGYRRHFTDISGRLELATTDTDATLVAARAGHTIFIQRIYVYIRTDAAQSLEFEDSSGTPVLAAKIPTSPGADTPWVFEFGDRGYPLTEGKAFMLDASAAGLGAHIQWDGYRRLTASSISPSSLASGS